MGALISLPSRAMQKFIFIVFVLLLVSCTAEHSPVRQESETVTAITAPEEIVLPTKASTPETEKPEYPGKAIDVVFPSTAHHGFDKENRNKALHIEMDDFIVNFHNYNPKTITKNSNVIFNFRIANHDEYWSALAGKSKLLGTDSLEIYTATTGPGGVCCTNYWITDLSGQIPKNIFRSEDWGFFREWMEIFDEDGDGIYEIMQWDSCFRYFMDDCGSCSPEPRAYFKYDKRQKQYLPAKGITQDFYLEDLRDTEKRLDDMLAQLREGNDSGLSLEHHRGALAHFANLIHIGEEKKAWEFLKKHEMNDAKMIKEINRRLSACPFYQYLRSKK